MLPESCGKFTRMTAVNPLAAASRRLLRGAALAAALCGLLVPGALSGASRNLEIYWIDAEGGAATLIVAPGGESMLVDSANRTPDDRDARRIAAAARLAGLTRDRHAADDAFPCRSHRRNGGAGADDADRHVSGSWRIDRDCPPGGRGRVQRLRGTERRQAEDSRARRSHSARGCRHSGDHVCRPVDFEDDERRRREERLLGFRGARPGHGPRQRSERRLSS